MKLLFKIGLHSTFPTKQQSQIKIILLYLILGTDPQLLPLRPRAAGLKNEITYTSSRNECPGQPSSSATQEELIHTEGRQLRCFQVMNTSGEVCLCGDVSLWGVSTHSHKCFHTPSPTWKSWDPNSERVYTALRYVRRFESRYILMGWLLASPVSSDAAPDCVPAIKHMCKAVISISGCIIRSRVRRPPFLVTHIFKETTDKKPRRLMFYKVRWGAETSETSQWRQNSEQEHEA